MKLEKTCLLTAPVMGLTNQGESVLILVKRSASRMGVMADPVKFMHQHSVNNALRSKTLLMPAAARSLAFSCLLHAK